MDRCANEREHAAAFRAFRHILDGVVARRESGDMTVEEAVDDETAEMVFDAALAIAETSLSAMGVRAAPAALEHARARRREIADSVILVRCTAVIEGGAAAWRDLRWASARFADGIVAGDGIREFEDAPKPPGPVVPWDPAPPATTDMDGCANEREYAAVDRAAANGAASDIEHDPDPETVGLVVDAAMAVARTTLRYIPADAEGAVRKYLERRIGRMPRCFTGIALCGFKLGGPPMARRDLRNMLAEVCADLA